MPLTLAIAGGMMFENDWVRSLVPLLRGEGRRELVRWSLEADDQPDDEGVARPRLRRGLRGGGVASGVASVASG